MTLPSAKSAANTSVTVTSESRRGDVPGAHASGPRAPRHGRCGLGRRSHGRDGGALSSWDPDPRIALGRGWAKGDRDLEVRWAEPRSTLGSGAELC